MCYTQNKLENKTNILTNKNKKENKMTNINTYKIPFQTYNDEAGFRIDPDKVSKESIAKIKARNIRLGGLGLALK